MSQESDNVSQGTGRTADLLDRHRAGDPSAREELIVYAQERLVSLARQKLCGFPGVGRWDETDDVAQEATIRLQRALSAMAPESPTHFWRLMAQQIRRTLLDLARRYQGPLGLGANHHTDVPPPADGGPGAPAHDRTDSTWGPSSLAEWTDLHEAVDCLPEEEQGIVNLRWYAGLTNEQAAEMLGISERTVKRRMLSARRMLARYCLLIPALD